MLQNSFVYVNYFIFIYFIYLQGILRDIFRGLRMNYFDYLNKKLENNAAVQNTVTVSNPFSSGLPVFGNIFNPNLPALKLNGNSIFTSAGKEELGKIDYTKIAHKDEDNQTQADEEKKLTPLEFVVREFLSLGKVKKEADDDGNGELSIDEIKDYIKELISKDGKDDDLSLEDFEAVIKELGIDLEELGQTSEQESVEEQPQTQETQPVSEQVSAQQTAATELPTVSQVSSNPFGSSAPATPSRPSSPAPVQPKTLDNMSLDELQSEKAARVNTLNEKQNLVNAINNGQNEKVKSAASEEAKAKAEYEKAVNEDPGLKKYAKEISKNNEKIEKNQKAIDENAVKIDETELKLSEAESSLDGLKGELSSLEASLSALSSDDKNKDKVKSLKAEISAKKKEISRKEDEVKDLKKSLKKLNNEKTKLEKEKIKLENEKNELDEKVKQYGSEETKSKLEAYNNAKNKVQEVKAAELSSAKADVTSAKAAVKEVEEKINIAKANQLKNKYSDAPAMNLSDVPESFKNQYGVSEKTLPDGTKVLACRWSRFNKCQQEWIELQQPMLKAAKNLGLTLVYSDVERTVAESNAGRAKKGALVCRGGESPHNYGVAADIVLFKNGQAVDVNSSLQTAFAQKVKENSNNRIEWGGDWSKQGERHHFNIRGWEQKYKNSSNLVG